MPQHLTPQRRSMLGPDAAGIYERLLHTTGNLTLTAYNSKLGDSPFDSKKHLLDETSNLEMNRWIADQPKWTEERIRQRAELLAERALRIWPGPIDM